MKLKHVLIANSLVCALFGLGFIAAPALLFTIFGSQTSSIAELVARDYGALLLGVALISWVSRNADLSVARTGIVAGVVLFHLLSAIVLVTGYLEGTVNAMAWLAIALSLLLAIGFLVTSVGRSVEQTPAIKYK